MVVCQGKSVLKGIAIGKIYLYEKQEYVLEQKQVADAEAEVARFEAAKETAIGQLDDLYEKALAEAGEEQAMIFDVHKMMLDDGDYLDAITGLIRVKRSMQNMQCIPQESSSQQYLLPWMMII